MQKTMKSKNFGQMLRQIREEKGFTQKEVGQAIGKSGQYISSIEKGRVIPDSNTIASLAYSLETESLIHIAKRDQAKKITNVPKAPGPSLVNSNAISLLTNKVAILKKSLIETLVVLQQTETNSHAKDPTNQHHALCDHDRAAFVEILSDLETEEAPAVEKKSFEYPEITIVKEDSFRSQPGKINMANNMVRVILDCDLRAWKVFKRNFKNIKEQNTESIALRNTPITVLPDYFKEIFGLDDSQRPLKYVKNDYHDNNDGTVTDRVTGLMWQQSGSNWMPLEDTKAYVEKLNRDMFAGHDDWRLPTIPELMSLIEPKRIKGGFFINPVFDSEKWWCWSSDLRSSGGVWVVGFNIGDVYWRQISDGFVRLVRLG